MGMVPSYKDNEWRVMVKHSTGGMTSTPHTTIKIRVLEGDEWRDYLVPNDPGNSDYVQYQEWLAEGNEPRIIL